MIKFGAFIFFILMGWEASFAQAENDFEKDIAKAADGLCECLNQLIGDLHPEVQNYVVNLQNKGKEDANKAFNQYLLTANDEAKLKIQQDGEKLSKLGENEKFNFCMKEFETKYKVYEARLDFLQKLESYLSKKEQCRLTYIFIKMGLAKK